MDPILRQAERLFASQPSKDNLLALWKTQQRAGVPVEIGLAAEFDWPRETRLTFAEHIDTQFSLNGILLDRALCDRFNTLGNNIVKINEDGGRNSDVFQLKRWFWNIQTRPIHDFHDFQVFGTLGVRNFFSYQIRADVDRGFFNLPRETCPNCDKSAQVLQFYRGYYNNQGEWHGPQFNLSCGHFLIEELQVDHFLRGGIPRSVLASLVRLAAEEDLAMLSAPGGTIELSIPTF